MFFGEEAQGLAKGFIDGIGGIISRFKADPTKVLELETELQTLAIDYEKSVIASVNETMQAEAHSEHWAQWLWRPCFGFTACAILINNYILLPYAEPFGVKPLVIPSEVWLMIMAVLGVAAWTRGTEKIEAVKKR